MSHYLHSMYPMIVILLYVLIATKWAILLHFSLSCSLVRIRVEQKERGLSIFGVVLLPKHFSQLEYLESNRGFLSENILFAGEVIT